MLHEMQVDFIQLQNYIFAGTLQLPLSPAFLQNKNEENDNGEVARFPVLASCPCIGLWS
jgi:hypothetical protein